MITERREFEIIAADKSDAKRKAILFIKNHFNGKAEIINLTTLRSNPEKTFNVIINVKYEDS